MSSNDNKIKSSIKLAKNEIWERMTSIDLNGKYDNPEARYAYKDALMDVLRIIDSHYRTV